MVSRDGDREVLKALAAHGSDLSKPAHTIHYLYFRSLDAAKSAARELEAGGYRNVRVDRAPRLSLWERLFGPREYTSIAETHAVPSEEGVFATSDWMSALADKFGGYYDGWEASIEE
ncbi:MAG TPA: ribonuclease E inhibitor RraB [Phycisphaerae bacterium]|nr:ribonuclease E inhibitor RraB [Phycisphaerae bacterium]